MLSIPSGSRSTYIGAGYRIAAAMAALEDTDLQAAESHLEAMAGHHAPEHRAPLTYVRTLLIEATDGVAGALNYLESRRRRGGRSPDPHVDRMLQALHSRLAWQSGRVQARSKNEPGGMAGIFAALSRNDARQAPALATELCRSPAARDTPRVHTEAL